MMQFLKYSILLLFTVLTACTQENTQPKTPYTDVILGRTVKYTITVLPADKVSKSTLFQDTVFVNLLMNDTLLTKKCNKNGMVSFTNLPAGNVAVSVKTKNYTQAFFTANIAIKDSSNFDAENFRTATTTLFLFPTFGNGMAKITGTAFAETNLTNTLLETVNKPVNFHFTFPKFPNQNLNSQNGEITDIHYQFSASAQTDTNTGLFTISLPASLSGLPIVISADDFETQFTAINGSTSAKIFSFRNDTLLVFPEKQYKYTAVYQLVQ